nr:hypothetical protein [uncultured bacterium]
MLTGHFSKTARSGAPPFLLVNKARRTQVRLSPEKGPTRQEWVSVICRDFGAWGRRTVSKCELRAFRGLCSIADKLRNGMMPNSNDPTLLGFQRAAESLKLARRADLTDPEQGTTLVDELYVDPLPEDAILRTILRPSTTFLIGRKGTGKSTIFQRLQSELRKTKHQTSAYVDIKTVFESSQVDPVLLERISKRQDALPPAELERLLLYKEFLREVVKQIKVELRKRVESSLWERVKERFTGSVTELFEGLDAVLEEADEERFISAIGLRTGTVQAKESASEEKLVTTAAAATLSETPALSVKGGYSERGNRSMGEQHDLGRFCSVH